MLTVFGALGQLWHVDQNPTTTTRRDVGFGILALGDAVFICVVNGSHEWEYEEREGTFHPTNAPAGARWRCVHIPKGHVFLAHSHLVHAGAPGRGGGDDDPLGFDVATARVHFLTGRDGNQEEGGTYPVAWRGEEKKQSTRGKACDDGSTGAPRDAPRDAPPAAAAPAEAASDKKRKAEEPADKRQRSKAARTAAADNDGDDEGGGDDDGEAVAVVSDDDDNNDDDADGGDDGGDDDDAGADETTTGPVPVTASVVIGERQVASKKRPREASKKAAKKAVAQKDRDSAKKAARTNAAAAMEQSMKKKKKRKGGFVRLESRAAAGAFAGNGGQKRTCTGGE